ncbi:hypothetical protein R5R35_010852 [Gryllus longicercus]|uniref:Ionotropic receptor n=1 Tax=Gryllus longicercus TaxID=2509291 RepID=A0AAN9W075_9ORTH
MPHDLAASTSDCERNWTHRGWDADIVYTLAAHTRTLDGCVRVDRAEVYPNGTHVGGMLDVTRGHVDVYGASRYHEHSLGHQVSYLYPHRQENICVAVKRLAVDQQVSLPSFSGNIWAATVSVLLLFFVALQLGLGVGFVPAVFAVVHTFVLGGFDGRHGRVMIWLSAFSFVMMNFLSGSLVGSLVSPDREAEIDSLEEVDARHPVVYATPVAAETVYHFTREDSPTVFSLGRKVRVVKWEQERRKALFEIANFGSAAIISGSIGLDSLTRVPETIRDGYSLLHRVKECVVAPAYYAFHVRRGWPLIGRFSELLQRLVQAGIITKMFARNLDLIIQDYHTLPLLPGLPSAPYQPLALLLLSPLFVFWVGNLVFALLVFLLEICLNCYCKRRAKKIPQE